MKRKPEKINIFVYWICLLYRWIVTRKKEYKFSYDYPQDKYDNEPVVYICDHSSYDNWINLLAGIKMTRTIRAVVGAMHLYTPKVGVLVRLTKCIPMKTYTTDINGSRKMLRAALHGQSIIMFP